jgi:hypothetical protein
MKKFLLIELFFAFGFISNSFADVFLSNEVPQAKTHLLDDLVDKPAISIQNGFESKHLSKVNMSCGLPPLPPLGCNVGDCVCDRNGNNCHWTFVCK